MIIAAAAAFLPSSFLRAAASFSALFNTSLHECEIERESRVERKILTLPGGYIKLTAMSSLAQLTILFCAHCLKNSEV
jgi:hypothetical protein